MLHVTIVADEPYSPGKVNDKAFDNTIHPELNKVGSKTFAVMFPYSMPQIDNNFNIFEDCTIKLWLISAQTKVLQAFWRYLSILFGSHDDIWINYFIIIIINYIVFLFMYGYAYFTLNKLYPFDSG